MFELLKAKPEQERRLLSALVNKVMYRLFLIVETHLEYIIVVRFRRSHRLLICVSILAVG